MRDDDAHAHVEQSTELHTSELREDISEAKPSGVRRR